MRRVLLASVLLVLAAAVPANAEYVGAGNDPRGDSTDPNPARDLDGAGISYDPRTGALYGVIGFAGEATQETDSLFTVVAGRKTDAGCTGYPAVGFGGTAFEPDTMWLGFDAPGSIGAKGRVSKRTSTDKGTFLQRFEYTGTALKGRSPNCAIATITAPTDANVVYDSAGPFDLVGQPNLGVALRDVPGTFLPNRPRTVTIRVTNPGHGPTARGGLTFPKAKGLRVSPSSMSLAPIRAGGRKTVKVKVRLLSSANTRTAFRPTVTAGRLKASDEERLYLKKGTRKRPSGGGGGGGSDVGKTCVRWSPDLSGESGGSLILVPC